MKIMIIIELLAFFILACGVFGIQEHVEEQCDSKAWKRAIRDMDKKK